MDVRPLPFIQRWFMFPLALGCLLAFGVLWFVPTAVTAPIVAVDTDQPRNNAVLPMPDGTFTVTQTFTPQHDGLQEVEILFVKSGEETPQASVSLRVLDDAKNVLVWQELVNSGIQHNQTQLLRFAPQAHSAGKTYTLEISGTAGNIVSVWGYTLDVYDGGSAAIVSASSSPPVLTAQDIHLTTRYRLTWGEAMRRLGQMGLENSGLFLLALFFIPLPGLLLLLTVPGSWRGWPCPVWGGTAVALGLSVWPVLWSVWSGVGGRWSGFLLWLLVIGGWMGVVALWRQRPLPLQWHTTDTALILLLLLGLAVRLLAVRDINTPPWVDASRHALITAVMVTNGRTPTTGYAPYLPIDIFPYHFGFHTIAASLRLMSGWPLPALLLYLGQLLNALIPLMVYTAVWLFRRQRPAALLAAFFVALPFFFPAYYVTWGRFTQLTAMLIMPVLVAVTWQVAQGARQHRHSWWLVGLLTTGLFLVHFRVFLLYLPFAGLLFLASRGRNGRYLLAAGTLTGLLTAVRFWQLIRYAAPSGGEALTNNIAGYNDFPVSYISVGWERPFLWLALAAWLYLLIALVRRRRWAWLPLNLAAWVALLFILLAGDKLGLPETTLINLNSMYIALFVPLAFFLALVGQEAWRLFAHWIWRVLAYVALGAGLTACLVFGVRQQMTILNSQTILTQPADLTAVAWAAQDLPPTAHIAINSWQWLGTAWAGSDAGAWLLPLTGRQVSTPPPDYFYSLPLVNQVAAFNEAAQKITDWSDPAAADWLATQGITTVFVGAKGGFFDPAALSRNPRLEMVYGRSGAFIFQIKPQ